MPDPEGNLLPTDPAYQRLGPMVGFRPCPRCGAMYYLAGSPRPRAVHVCLPPLATSPASDYPDGAVLANGDLTLLKIGGEWETTERHYGTDGIDADYEISHYSTHTRDPLRVLRYGKGEQA